MKAWTGLGLLGKVEEVFLKISGWEWGRLQVGIALGSRSLSGMPRLSQALLSLLSSLWKLGGEEEKEEDRTGGKKLRNSGLMALHSLVRSGLLSLRLCLALCLTLWIEGGDGRL